MPVSYPWNEIIARAQISVVRNIVGGRDFWAKVAAFIPWTGAGNSGAKGFYRKDLSDIVDDVIYEEFDHGDAHYPDVFKARVVPFLENSRIKTNAPKANYLTYVDPFHAACWTAVMYTRQYIDRFFRALPTNDFFYRTNGDTQNESKLDSSPKGFVIVIPDSPSSASPQGRDDFEREFNLQPIVFSKKARGASLSSDGFIYDIPSALESFNVYSESTGNHASAMEALESFTEIMREAISMKYGGYSNPPQVKTLTLLREEKGQQNVRLQQTDSGLS